MPTVTLRLEKEQLKELQKLAYDNNQTMNDFILGLIFPTKNLNNKLTLQKVVEIALEQPSGAEFSIPSLFSFNIWQSYDPSDKRIVGRTFFKLIQDTNTILAKEFIFVGKTSNIAIYRRL